MGWKWGSRREDQRPSYVCMRTKTKGRWADGGGAEPPARTICVRWSPSPICEKMRETHARADSPNRHHSVPYSGPAHFPNVHAGPVQENFDIETPPPGVTGGLFCARQKELGQAGSVLGRGRVTFSSVE